MPLLFNQLNHHIGKLVLFGFFISLIPHFNSLDDQSLSNQKLDYSGAITQLKKARRLSRERFSVRFLLIFCYSQLNKPINASKQLSLAAKIASRSSDKLKIEAMQNYLSQDFRLSINLLKGLLKKNRNNSLEYYLIAKCYSELNKPRSAKVYLDKIAKSSSYFYIAQSLLANNHKNSGAYQQAVGIYTILSKDVYDNPVIHYQASLAEEKAGNYLQASISINNERKIPVRGLPFYQRQIEILRIHL